jgi:hypothetical protein
VNKSEQINELATALAGAQAELENASKSSNNPHFKSKYADLAEVLNTVRPVLAKHGLSVAQFPGYSHEHKVVAVETVLMHKSGQYLSGTVAAPVTKPDAQGVGSAITYCRRYSLAAVVGIAQEDDDGNEASGRKGGHTAHQDPEAVVNTALGFMKNVRSLEDLSDYWADLPKYAQGNKTVIAAATEAKARLS